jgi:hypothetical protein
MKRNVPFSMGWMGRVSASIFASLFFLLTQQLQAQTWSAINCNNQINVSLDGDCRATIRVADMLLGNYPNTYSFSIKISNTVGTIVTKPGNYMVTITHMQSGNSCWGNLLAEDKLPPVILTCPCAQDSEDPNCTFACNAIAGVKNGTIAVPEPTIQNGCGTVKKFTSDRIIDEARCGYKTLVRSYWYKDEAGNKSATCEAYYRFTPLELDEVVPPAEVVELPCNAGTTPEQIFNYFKTTSIVQANLNAWPTYNGLPVGSDKGECNLLRTYTDAVIYPHGVSCPSSKKIIRTWQVYDWCQNKYLPFTQTIKSLDLTGPTIVAANISTTVDPWNCVAKIEFPAPTTLEDNCTTVSTYTIEGPEGITLTYNASTKKYSATNVKKGEHTFIYKAQDCSGNEGRRSITVKVEDKTKPVAVSKEFVVVTLSQLADGTGFAKVHAESIDNGSHDGCGKVHIEIRRDTDSCNIAGNTTYNNDGHPNDAANDTDEGKFIRFCCADLTGTENGVPFGRVKVWLRVWDDGDMNGEFGTAGDNYNEAWSWIRVEDKAAPTITCPAPITINCDQNYKDLDLTKRATAKATCANIEVTYEDKLMLNLCGQGTVDRKWSVKGSTTINCVQRIKINSPSNAVTIVWPKDTVVDCKNLPTRKPRFSGSTCNSLGVSTKSDTFEIEKDACLKIINKFTVIDWCTYDQDRGTGIWHGTQTIKVVDKIAPVITCTDSNIDANDSADNDNDKITCEARNVKISNSATDNGSCASKWIKWTVFVDISANGTNDYEFSSFVSAADNSFSTDNNGNGVPDIYVTPTSSGEQVNLTLPVDLPGGTSHKIHWKATDGCGNPSSCTSTLTVSDRKAPTPYCVSISTALMKDGSVELWAKDFDKGSFDNCTSAANLIFTFDQAKPVASKIAEEHYFKGNGLNATAAEYKAGTAQRWLPSAKSSSLLFGCDDLPSVSLKMSVWDEQMFTDFCIVQLALLDNQKACSPSPRIAIGGAVNFFNSKVANAEIKLLTTDNTELGKNMSKENGSYLFNDNEMHNSYVITAAKNDDILNGLSTLDLVLIQRHILGSSKLEGHNAIAADINGDGKISATDLVELRKVLLGILDQFKSKKSWRFYDEAALATGELKESILLEKLDHEMQNANFVGLKIGDVNASALSNSRQTAAANRSRNTIQLYTEEQMLQNGHTYEVKVYSSANDIAAVQMALYTKGITIQDIKVNGRSMKDQYHVIDAASANLSIVLPHDETIDEFTLVVKALSNGSLSDKLHLRSDARYNSEVYQGTQLTEANVEMVYRDRDASVVGLELYQNQPNPFNESTLITFYSDKVQPVKLTVSDVLGRVLYSESKTCLKGRNDLTLQSSTLGNISGMLYYQIETDDAKLTKTMIGLK